jgi:hypothetical protein
LPGKQGWNLGSTEEGGFFFGRGGIGNRLKTLEEKLKNKNNQTISNSAEASWDPRPFPESTDFFFLFVCKLKMKITPTKNGVYK